MNVEGSMTLGSVWLASLVRMIERSDASILLCECKGDHVSWCARPESGNVMCFVFHDLCFIPINPSHVCKGVYLQCSHVGVGNM